MLRGIRNGRRARGLVAALFAFALLLRIAIPSGFMPTQTAQGIVIRICDGMGEARTMVLDVQRPGDGQHDPDHDQPAAACAFAGLAMPALDASPGPVPALPAMSLEEFALPPPASVVLAGTDVVLPPLRGPPAHA
ncbi:hypothetical protein FHS96_003394 [Sphingomonas zeicaulis]|uniref:hypothetical protein n=1 Tax=Sphingomonas zeicaulis TaxID=1632740 RepID=UPI003D1ACD4C